MLAPIPASRCFCDRVRAQFARSQGMAVPNILPSKRHPAKAWQQAPASLPRPHQTCIHPPQSALSGALPAPHLPRGLPPLLLPETQP